jgi:hypothetical protein
MHKIKGPKVAIRTIQVKQNLALWPSVDPPRIHAYDLKIRRLQPFLRLTLTGRRSDSEPFAVASVDRF